MNKKYPVFLQRLVKFAVKKILHEDIDELRSAAVSEKLKVMTLWASGKRVYSRFGTRLCDTPEFEDLLQALNQIRPVNLTNEHKKPLKML